MNETANKTQLIATAYNDSADIVERIEAIETLAFDGYKEMKPLLQQLLNRENHFLRAEAIKTLLARWEDSDYIDKAIEILKNDNEWSVRSSAAFSLAEYLKYSDKKENVKDKILEELVHCLLNDKDESVQETCYEKFYEIVTGKYLKSSSTEFDRNGNVDWNLLQPYLDKYGLQKPD